MEIGHWLRVVVDTNVLFEGLTKKGTASALIVDAWLAGILPVAVCEALAHEYVDVLARSLSPERWERLQPVVHALLIQAEYVSVYFTWRPSSPDPADEHVVDCVLNANAILITWNVRDFRRAVEKLEIKVFTPPEFVAWWSHLVNSDATG